MPGARATLWDAMGKKDLREETDLQEGRGREMPQEFREGSNDKEILEAKAITAAWGFLGDEMRQVLVPFKTGYGFRQTHSRLGGPSLIEKVGPSKSLEQQ